MNDAPAIHLSVADNAARLTITNPAKKNAMTLAMWRALPDLVARCEADPSVRLIVLAGAGDTFCAGADISEFGENRADAAAARHYAEAVEAANAALANASKPTVALICGVCYGGGFGLALACDLRFARADARFRIPAARLSLGYSYADVAFVASRIGVAATADLLFSARVFDADQARRDGIVRDAFSLETFASEAESYIGLLSENAPLSLAAVKAALTELLKPEAARDVARVDDAVARCFTSEDYKEGQKAFAERRKPAFRGR